jgi:hypothetical protein
MMMPAPVAALTTPLYRLATSAKLRWRPTKGTFWLLLLLLATAALLDDLAAKAGDSRQRQGVTEFVPIHIVLWLGHRFEATLQGLLLAADACFTPQRGHRRVAARLLHVKRAL